MARRRRFGEEALLGLELAGVNAAAAGFDADGVLKVEHLVVEQVLYGAAGGIGAVEDAANDDGVVGGVVVAEHAAGGVGGPGEGGSTEQAVEKTAVEGLEDFVEVVVVADGGGDALAATSLADLLGLSGDGLGPDVTAVAVGVHCGDGLFVELGEQNVCDSLVDGFGRVLEQVGEADVETAFAEANSGIERGEPAKANIERWDGRARTKVAVLLLEDEDEGGVHANQKVNMLSGGWERPKTDFALVYRKSQCTPFGCAVDDENVKRRSVTLRGQDDNVLAG